MGIFKKSDSQYGETQNISLIAHGTKIIGTIVSENIIQLDGSFEGTITSKQVVYIGKQGSMNGEILAEQVIINGELKGTIDAEKVELGENAKVSATIMSNGFSIHEGAQYEGEKKLRIGTSSQKVIESKEGKGQK